MKPLYLHIGHGKTGSSYIQASLAQSVDTLKNVGIKYPVSPRMRDLAKDQKLSYGNGRGLLADPSRFSDWLSKHSEEFPGSILASSELLFRELFTLRARWDSGEEAISNLHAITSSHGIEKIKILLLVRSPVEIVPSYWQQRVKYHGETRTLKDFINSSNYTKFSKESAKIIDIFGNVDFIDLSISNYSCVKTNILHDFELWLGCPDGTLQKPVMEKINRTLTAAEIEIQRQLNQKVRPDEPNHILAKRFSWELPEIEAEHIQIDSETAAILWEAEVESIEKLNRLLPVDQMIAFSGGTGSKNLDRFSFNADQLSIIADEIAQSLTGSLKTEANVEVSKLKGLFSALLSGKRCRRSSNLLICSVSDNFT